MLFSKYQQIRLSVKQHIGATLVHMHLYISHAVQMSANHESDLIAQNRWINPNTYVFDYNGPPILTYTI